MAFPFLPLLSGLGSGLSAGAGSESTTESSFESDTTGSSKIDRTEFSPRVLKALEGLFGAGNLRRNFRQSNNAIRTQLQSVQEQQEPFDVQAFVNGVMTQANNTIDNATEQAINLGESDIGGTMGTNSMAALLGNKLATDAAAQKSGILAEATARGTEIANANMTAGTENIINLTGAGNKTFTDFLQILRGARTKQKQKTEEHTEGTSTSTTSSPFNPMSAIGGFLSSFKAPT